MRFLLLSLLCISGNLLAQHTLDEAIDAVSATLAHHIASTERGSVAVSDLVTLSGDSTALGKFIAEEFTLGLLRHAAGFEVMDRAHLQAIFAEHRLAMSGLTSEASLIELGKLVSVDAIVTGTLVQLPEWYKITVKLLDTETGRLRAGDHAFIARDPALDMLFGGREEPSSESVDCAGTDTGTILFEHGGGQGVTVAIVGTEHERIHRREGLDPGTSYSWGAVPSGVVRYTITHAGSRLGGGTVFLKACETKRVRITGS